MSSFNLSAVGRQFSAKCTKENEKKSKVKPKSEWCCRTTTPIERAADVNWHGRCFMYPNILATSETRIADTDNLCSLFGNRSDVFRSTQHFKPLNKTIQRIYDADLFEDFNKIIQKLKLTHTRKPEKRIQTQDPRNEYYIRIASMCYQDTFQSQINILNSTKNKLNRETNKNKITADTFSKILTAINSIASFKKETNSLKKSTFRIEIVSNNIKKALESSQ